MPFYEKKKILEEEFGIEMTEELEEEVERMCNLSEGIERRGIRIGLERGMERGLTQSIHSIMKKMSYTSEQAMDVLEIPKEERARYKALLEKPM